MAIEFIRSINDFLWEGIVLGFLLIAGLFFTIYLRFVQIRLGKEALKALLFQKAVSKRQISSFQALCTSLAQRVGTGNLAGVAAALTYGGEGAIFWMWMTAILGSSTAFAESTLAQVFKLKKSDGTFHGGPAYYLHAGLRSKKLAILFSFLLIFAMGFIFNAVQSNTIAQGLWVGLGIKPLYCGMSLALFAAFVIFGGQKRISQVAEILVPIMALFYLALMVFVMVRHAQEIPGLFKRIFSASLAAKSAVGGILGHTVREAIRHGVSRGLFSNEAGFGSSPNAAASADVTHPVEQGLVQMLAVYIDTLLICTATAFIILLSPSPIDGNITGIALTQAAAEFHFGFLGKIFIGIAILLFGFTTILGNTFYGEANVQFISEKPAAIFLYRILVLAMVVFGSTLSVPMVWQMADLMSALMVLINLSGVMLMATIVKKTTQHFQNRQLIKSPFSFESIGLIHTTQYDFAFDKKPK
jgi:AGCS family alanine or glycine:cation symporter